MGMGCPRLKVRTDTCDEHHMDGKIKDFFHMMTADNIARRLEEPTTSIPSNKYTDNRHNLFESRWRDA